MGRRPLPAAVRLRLEHGRRPRRAARPAARGGRARPGLRHRRAGRLDPGTRRPGLGAGQRPGHGRGGPAPARRRPGPAGLRARLQPARAGRRRVLQRRLHWMPRPAEVIGRVWAAVGPGGRFVAELGGAGNIEAILEALGATMAEAGLPAPECPWYFPTPGQYATLLEAGGVRGARVEHFPRPTPLAGGPDGPA